MRFRALALSLVTIAGCASSQRQARHNPTVVDLCDGRARLRVHFYDVGQGLAALVDLPDGLHILVDAGEDPHRAGCGPSCGRASEHLVAQLVADLAGAPIAMLWITHQHSDHLGGVPAVMARFKVLAYVDNGTGLARPSVERARSAATEQGAPVTVVDVEHTELPLHPQASVRLRAILPTRWPTKCDHDPNNCSIGLRVDFCASSVLFTGDAESAEEPLLDPLGPVTLLQVAHHGSDTSTTTAFLSAAVPRYSVISAGKPGEGAHRAYCHPRAGVVGRLNAVLGGEAGEPVVALDGQVGCKDATPEDWVAVLASARLWTTARDGDVILETVGDGVFRRVR